MSNENEDIWTAFKRVLAEHGPIEIDPALDRMPTVKLLGEINKLAKQRGELVEWLEDQKIYHHNRARELSGGFGSHSESAHCGHASAMDQVIKFIKKQGGE